MDLVAYTLGQRIVMSAVIAWAAWYMPTVLCQSVPSRSCVSLGEFAAAYRAHYKFGLDLDEASIRVLRTVGLVIAVFVAFPEILGLL